MYLHVIRRLRQLIETVSVIRQLQENLCQLTHVDLVIVWQLLTVSVISSFIN